MITSLVNCRDLLT
jgi:dynein heavy chain, axonemal